jgi:hypothetical protein
MQSEVLPMAVRGERVPPLARARARLHAAGLDEELAGGVDPASRPELSARAAWLCSRRSRAALAGGLYRTLRAAEQPRRLWSAAVEVDREAVRFARPELLALAEALGGDGRIRPRGAALTRRLVTDGTGPLFTGGPDELLGAAREALRALDVGEGLMAGPTNVTMFRTRGRHAGARATQRAACALDGVVEAVDAPGHALVCVPAEDRAAILAARREISALACELAERETCEPRALELAQEIGRRGLPALFTRAGVRRTLEEARHARALLKEGL